jgi:hypothetical protein
MLVADIPGARQRAVMRGRARITPKYSVEITLYDFDDVYLNEVIWAPHLPSPGKQKALAHKINAALLPFHAKALEVAGPLEGESS